jgi:hypothetical protein
MWKFFERSLMIHRARASCTSGQLVSDEMMRPGEGECGWREGADYRVGLQLETATSDRQILGLRLFSPSGASSSRSCLARHSTADKVHRRRPDEPPHHSDDRSTDGLAAYVCIRVAPKSLSLHGI